MLRLLFGLLGLAVGGASLSVRAQEFAPKVGGPVRVSLEDPTAVVPAFASIEDYNKFLMAVRSGVSAEAVKTAARRGDMWPEGARA
jgi:hypothetical protein